MIFTVHQAKLQLSKLIAAALNGEEVVIARGDKPVLKLTPIEPPKKKRVFGAYKGEFNLTDAFFEPLPDHELAHKDPFDRLLIGQSLLEHLPLVSNEAIFAAAGVSRIW